MYQLFQPPPADASGGFMLPDWRRVRTGLQHSINRVTDYARDKPLYVPGQHMLVRLLQSLNVPMSMDLDMFTDKVGDRALDLAMAMKLTSPLSRGKIWTPGVFYGEHIEEVILATIEPFDRDQMRENWHAQTPIRVVYHPQTDLNLQIPTGQRASEEGGPAVIVINIPMLAAQYWCWRRFEQRSNSDDSPSTIMQFLSAYPLPNMLPSHLDIAIFNRMTHLYFGIELPKIRPRHPFYLVDWQYDVDRLLKKWIEYLQTKRWKFDVLIDNFPTVSAQSYHDVIKLPAMSYSHQVQWAVFLSRLALVLFLVKLNSDTHNSNNGNMLNAIRIYLNQMEHSQSLRMALSDERYQDVLAIINDGIRAYL